MKVLFALLPLTVSAQQDPQFSQYMLNPYIWNPSYPALKDQYVLSAHHRTQWLGYSTSYNSDQIAAPSTQLFTATAPVLKLKSAFGIQVMNDDIGPLRNFTAGISYAYRIDLGEGRLALGVGLGVGSMQVNSALWRAENPNDPTLSATNFTTVNQVRPNFRIGVSYGTENLFLGLSINNVSTPTYSLGTSTIESRLVRHYYAQAGYTLYLSEVIRLQPSFIFKNISGVSSLELSSLFLLNKLWFGMSYRTSDAVIGLVGLNIFPDNSLKLGYNIDLSVINAGGKSQTSHEIYLSYNIGSILDNRKPIVRSPRFRL